MAISGRNRYNISPIRHLTLAVRIVAHRNYRTIGFQANRVIPNSRNRHNICPITVSYTHLVEVTGKVQVEGGSVTVEGAATKESLLKRAKMCCAEKQWKKAG